MKDPLVPVLLAFSGGILLSRGVYFRAPELLWALFSLYALALLARRYSKHLAFWACLAPLTLTGTLVDVLYRPGPAPTIDATSQELVILSGCVVEPPVFYENRDQFTVELARRSSARVSLTVQDGESPPDLRYGQRVEFDAHVRAIRNFHNPGSFDFEQYSARRNIYWNASVPHGDPVRVLPGRCGSRFFAGIFALRSAALRRIEALYPNDAYATGMMEAILIGETGKLDKVWTDHFKQTGTFHALVISGMHIAVLAGTLLFLLRLCSLPEIPALVITAVIIWIYALVSGWSAPAVRAAGGLTLYLGGRYFYRQRRLMNLLAAVAIFYLLCDPGQLFESSFQLSFLSVVAIGTLAVPFLEASSRPLRLAVRGIVEERRALRLEPKAASFRLELRLLAETLSYYVRLPRIWLLRGLAFFTRLGLYVYDMVVISAAIQVGLALPMAIYFHRISFSGLSANTIIVPLLSMVVPIGFFAVFSGWRWVAIFAEWLLVLSERVANWHVRFEPDWRVADPPVWLSIAFAACLVLLTFAIRLSWKWRAPALASVFVLFSLVFLHPFPPKVRRGALELSAIDVGQGDGLLVAFPDGKLMMVDGGGFANFGRKMKSKLDIGEDVISPYLWSRSITKLDVIVLTHAHEDHAGGVPALIANFHPAELWTGANGNSDVWREVRTKALARHVRVEEMRYGRNFDYGGTHIEVLSPPVDYEATATPKNNDSLVLRVTYGKQSFLLTGDMEKQMEADLLSHGRALTAEVLKVGHHGSKTSSTEEFLDAVHPAFAIISDGFENSFHHPNGEVLKRLREHHTAILRTDQLGLITIRSDGRKLSFETAIDE